MVFFFFLDTDDAIKITLFTQICELTKNALLCMPGQ